MYEISVRGSFRATHQVATPSGELEPRHEHDWRIEAVWSGRRLDDRGLLVDFACAEQVLRRLASTFEGKHLNEHPRLPAQRRKRGPGVLREAGFGPRLRRRETAKCPCPGGTGVPGGVRTRLNGQGCAANRRRPVP
jgi:6-pyruvoyl-tetrahydropterin synthase